jgi:hypothetical protein
VISGKRLEFASARPLTAPKVHEAHIIKIVVPAKAASKYWVHPSTRHSRESGNPVAFVKKALGSRLAVPRNFALRARFRGNDERLAECLAISLTLIGSRRFNTSHSPECAETE